MQVLNLEKIDINDIPIKKNNSNVIVIHAGADYIGRRWSEIKYVELIDLIIKSKYFAGPASEATKRIIFSSFKHIPI